MKTFFITSNYKGEELDICYSNLFHPVDKLFNKSIESNLPHPPLIALIMRRSTGIQALECHIMIAKSPCDAKQIVDGIKDVCSKYKQTLNQNTSVFQYTPYNELKSSNNVSNEQKSYEVDINVINQLKQKEKHINQQSFLINQPNPTTKLNNNLGQLPPKFPPISINNKIVDAKDGKNVRDSSVDNSKSRSSSASNNKNNNLKLNMQSKSSSNMSSSKSVFSKLKHNLMDKSSSNQKTSDSSSISSTSKKEKKTETKQKNSIFNKLSSSSAVVFSETNNNKQVKEVKKKNVSTKSTATSTDFDLVQQQQHKRSSSALDNIIITDSSKKDDSNLLLKNPSLISFNLDDGISSGVGNFSKANSSGSKREKKPSFGKRLLMSARSSLKSNTSADIKQNSDQVRALSSNSTASLFSSKADKKKSAHDIGDIDFRKSKTSFNDANLVIDNKCSSNHHRSRRQSASSNVLVDDMNRQSRAVTPNLIINSSTNRLNANSAIDCCIYNSNHHCRDGNFILKTRSPGPPSTCHHQLRHSPAHPSKSPFHNHHHHHQLRSITPTSSTRIIFADKITKSSHSINNNNSPIKLSSYCINTANSSKDEVSSSNQRSSSAVSVNRKQIPIEADVIVNSPALSYKSACIINQTKSKSNLNEYAAAGEVNKTYLTNDPRLFSNHLVWNKSKNTAESVDNKYSAPSSITVITTSNAENPVVRAISPCPGYINSSSPNKNKTNSRSEIEIKIQTANIIPNSSSPLLPPRPSSSQYDAQLNKLNQTKAKLNSNIKETKSVLLSTSIDSAYNTNTSNEMDSEFEKVTIHREKTEPVTNKCCATNVSQTHEKFSPFFITETKKDFEFNNSNNTCCQASLIDRVKLQHEDHQSTRKSTVNQQLSSDSTSTTTTSHKVVGGVKVFPSLPHQHKQAAEMRRQRLNAIEANLVEIENKSKINSADLNLGHTNSQFNLIQTTSNNQASMSSSTSNQEETTKSSSSQIYDFNNTSSAYKLLDDVNDTEIIDLTKKCKNLEIKTTTSSIVKKNETIETQSQNIQIEILTSDKMTKKDLDMDKYLFGDNIHTTTITNNSNNSSNNNKLKSSSIVIESPSHLSSSQNCNQKTNFIYYYDNEHFGGY